MKGYGKRALVCALIGTKVTKPSTTYLYNLIRATQNGIRRKTDALIGRAT